MPEKLTRVEERCLRLSYERSKGMPCYPDSIQISFRVSRLATIESVHRKGWLIWTSHRGSSYEFTDEAREFVGAPRRPGT